MGRVWDDIALHLGRPAFPVYGKHRALQAALVDLLKRDLISLGSTRKFRVQAGNYNPPSQEDNPLIPALLAEPEGSMHSYDAIMINWFDREKFTHPLLERLDRFAHKRLSWYSPAYLLPAALAAIFLIRMAQGIYNERPVGLLVAEAIPLTILVTIISRFTGRNVFVYKKIKKLFTRHIGDLPEGEARIIPRYALEGRPAILGFAEGYLLANLFDSYNSPGFRNNLESWDNSASGSDGGASCGGGGGCGGCSGGD